MKGFKAVIGPRPPARWRVRLFLSFGKNDDVCVGLLNFLPYMLAQFDSREVRHRPARTMGGWCSSNNFIASRPLLADKNECFSRTRTYSRCVRSSRKSSATNIVGGRPEAANSSMLELDFLAVPVKPISGLSPRKATTDRKWISNLKATMDCRKLLKIQKISRIWP